MKPPIQHAHQSVEDLLPAVYTELHRLAVAKMAQERPGQTLQATALVHEAWLRLSGENRHGWKDRHHYIRAAAAAMRRILIDHARHKNACRHGGQLHRVNLDCVSPASRMPSDELLAVDEALERLEEEDHEAARLVELRFFVGLGHQEAAEIMGLTRRQADGIWQYARAWLRDALQEDLGANDRGNTPS